MSNPDEQKLGKVLENSYVRLSTMLAMLGAIVGGAYMLGGAINDFENRLDGIDSQLEAIDTRLDEGLKGPDRWTRQNQRGWCRETELINDEWKCAEVERR